MILKTGNGDDCGPGTLYALEQELKQNGIKTKNYAHLKSGDMSNYRGKLLQDLLEQSRKGLFISRYCQFDVTRTRKYLCEIHY